jgi:hypothetical protein
MADFFSRIAGRTLGVLPTVKPSLPPMFARVPSIETPETDANASSARSDDVAFQTDLPGERADPSADRQGQPPAQDRRWKTLVSPPLVSPLPVKVAREAAESRSEAKGPESREWTREPSVMGRPLPAASNSEITAAQYSAPAPTVQVTIGRVEVRAITPAAQPPRMVTPKSPPLSSLEEYLRERNGRRR